MTYIINSRLRKYNQIKKEDIYLISQYNKHQKEEKDKIKNLKLYYGNNMQRFINLEDKIIEDTFYKAKGNNKHPTCFLHNIIGESVTNFSFSIIESEGFQSIVRKKRNDLYRIGYSLLYNQIDINNSKNIIITRKEFHELFFDRQIGFYRNKENLEHVSIQKTIIVNDLKKIKGLDSFIELINIIENNQILISELNNIYLSIKKNNNPKEDLLWKEYKRIFNVAKCNLNYITVKDFSHKHKLNLTELTEIEKLFTNIEKTNMNVSNFLKYAHILFKEDFFKNILKLPRELQTKFVELVDDCSSEDEVMKLLELESFYINDKIVISPIKKYAEIIKKNPQLKEINDINEQIKFINIKKFFNFLEKNNFKITEGRFYKEYKIFKFEILKDPIWAFNYLYSPEDLIDAYLNKKTIYDKSPKIKNLNINISDNNNSLITVEHDKIKKSNLKIIASILEEIYYGVNLTFPYLQKNIELKECEFEMIMNASSFLFSHFPKNRGIINERKDNNLYKATRTLIKPILYFYKNIQQLIKISLYDTINLLLLNTLFNVEYSFKKHLLSNKNYYKNNQYMVSNLITSVNHFDLLIKLINNEIYPIKLRENIKKDLINNINHFSTTILKYKNITISNHLNELWYNHYNTQANDMYKKIQAEIDSNKLIKNTDKVVFYNLDYKTYLEKDVQKQKDAENNNLIKNIIQPIISFLYKESINIDDIIISYHAEPLTSINTLLVLEDKHHEYFIIYKKFGKLHKHYLGTKNDTIEGEK